MLTLMETIRPASKSSSGDVASWLSPPSHSGVCVEIENCEFSLGVWMRLAHTLHVPVIPQELSDGDETPSASSDAFRASGGWEVEEVEEVFGHRSQLNLFSSLLRCPVSKHEGPS